ncbi:hypothetical protein EGT07_21580 [Herbaspirillum sp. HC18]|nr:hypothetical protein EGT07_21580 [Herbaspirillum sp. HC18]
MSADGIMRAESMRQKLYDMGGQMICATTKFAIADSAQSLNRTCSSLSSIKTSGSSFVKINRKQRVPGRTENGYVSSRFMTWRMSFFAT